VHKWVKEQNLEEGTTSKKLYLNYNGKRTLKDKQIKKIKDKQKSSNSVK
jgi:hypothetical protein